MNCYLFIGGGIGSDGWMDLCCANLSKNKIITGVSASFTRLYEVSEGHTGNVNDFDCPPPRHRLYTHLAPKTISAQPCLDVYVMPGLFDYGYKRSESHANCGVLTTNLTVAMKNTRRRNNSRLTISSRNRPKTRIGNILERFNK